MSERLSGAQLGFAPAGMDRDLALAYTAVSDQQMRKWQREGVVRFLPIGPHGKLITTRDQLDEALRQMFAGGSDLSEDWDFGD